MPDINPNEEFKRLLAENLADTKLIKAEVAKIRGYMRWRTIISIIWIVLLALPLVAGLLFIPDILKGVSASSLMLQSLGL